MNSGWRRWGTGLFNADGLNTTLSSVFQTKASFAGACLLPINNQTSLPVLGEIVGTYSSQGMYTTGTSSWHRFPTPALPMKPDPRFEWLLCYPIDRARGRLSEYLL